ncbi:MAG TPA: winged helix-turn-helix domain-containing protein, partial [Polyangiales bacterium]|nr:winged helix-turn-helix domain-containing protein [Polyangiales bacterium]
DGLEVLRRLRATSNNVPVLMLTARGEDTDRIVGLELGADDYLPKPFNPREVVARLTAILRRGRALTAPQGDVLRFGKLEIDRAAHEARVAGKPCLLTAHQFEILRVLAERAGRVQTREQLMQAVRGEDLEEFDRSIDVHISRIRAAIEDDPKHPKRIRTVRAVGYVFAPLAEDLP